MPFKSKAQQKKMFALEAEGKIKKGTAERWAKETPNIKALPQKVSKSKSGPRSTADLRATYEKKFGKKK